MPHKILSKCLKGLNKIRGIWLNVCSERTMLKGAINNETRGRSYRHTGGNVSLSEIRPKKPATTSKNSLRWNIYRLRHWVCIWLYIKQTTVVCVHLTWSWSMSESPVMTMRFSMRVSDCPPFSVCQSLKRHRHDVNRTEQSYRTAIYLQVLKCTVFFTRLLV